MTSSMFLAQKLISFTESVFWLAHGLERRHALNFGSENAPAGAWSAETFAEIVTEWRGIMSGAGVDPGSVAATALASLPVESLLTQSQRSEIFLNFLIYLAKAGAAAIPDAQIADPQIRQLYDLLREQDIAVTQSFEDGLLPDTGVFLQIGANDGNAPDDQNFHPIYRNPGWRKILLEPNPDAAAGLRAFVRGMPGVTVLEAAVSDRSGSRMMTMHDHSRLSTFEQDALERGSGRQVPVQCLDGPDLFETAALNEVDVFVCDTEGHDRVVVEQVLGCTQPSLICVEYANLATSDRIRLLQMLQAHGYRWCRAPLSLDVLAIRGRD